MARVLLVDEHPLFRRGLASLLQNEPDLQLCGEGESVTEALRLVHELKPDVLVADVHLGEGSGLQLVKSIRAQSIHIPILVISMYKEEVLAERVLRAGANGYINKTEASTNVVSAIRHVLKGKLYLTGATAERLIRCQLQGHGAPHQPLEARLSDREMEVYMMLGQGYATKRIASELHLSTKTVDSHKEHIKKKLGLDNNTSLICHAVAWMMERS